MSTKDPVKTLLEKLADTGVCMLTTTHEGRIYSRPMALQEVDDDHSLWFLTRLTSPKIEDTTGGQAVNVTVAEKGFWASVSGTATVVRDVERQKEYWSKATESFYGDASPEDPQVVLLRVEPDTAEYWDSPGLAATAFEMVRGKVTGEPARPGDNPTVQL
ncbi:MAG: stress protein [Citricoccus sp.]|jgi:general stress protein 26|nr:stress protein [Citricoccus sp. WCRC_4]